jgi:hypothetical protein
MAAVGNLTLALVLARTRPLWVNRVILTVR